MRYRKLAFITILSCASTCAAEDPLILAGSKFPNSIGGAQWLQVTNYAHDGSPGGVGVGYRSPKLKADIYLYDAGDPSWVSKSLDDRIVAESLSIPGVMKEMEQRGYYSSVMISDAEHATAGGLNFIRLRISYEEKGEKKRSHFYLAKYRERILKIRLTAVEPFDDSLLHRAFTEACASFEEKVRGRGVPLDRR